jgi:pilus assembly protein CpaB
MLLRILLFSTMATGLAGFGTVAWISTRPPPVSIVAGVAVPTPVNVYLLAAAHTLRPGVLLKPDDLTTATTDQAAVPPGALIDTPTARAELLGAMLRRTVIAGEVLLPMHVMRAGERGFLAAVLGPGMRATTVGVDAVTGTAGLIWPGDHVDLILTETLDDPGMPMGRRIAGETVLHNVRVIAIDQELMQGAAGTPAPTNGAAQSRTVTLEVSPSNAERVAVATRLGHLSLSVISADMPDEPATPNAMTIKAAAHEAVTWGGDVSAALLSGRKADPGSGSMHVYEGGAEVKELHF